MDINKALEVTGFSLCEFKFNGTEQCKTCSVIQPEGGNVYYERTCYDSNEGEYHCEKCTTLLPPPMGKMGCGVQYQFTRGR